MCQATKFISMILKTKCLPQLFLLPYMLKQTNCNTILESQPDIPTSMSVEGCAKIGLSPLYLYSVPPPCMYICYPVLPLQTGS